VTMGDKLCSKCEYRKPLDSFARGPCDGLQNWCRQCKATHYTQNKEKHNLWSAERYEANKLAVSVSSHARYIQNRASILEKTKTYKRNRSRTDPKFRLAGNLRSRLSRVLRGRAKNGSAVKDLGCSIEELKAFLEAKFQVGMNWDNYGEWHIDHIRPISSFDLTSPTQLRLACHYTNLQPLWAFDNLRKSDRMVG
jgi:hypothetical protein